MKVHILFNDFEFRIEQVSCNGKKMQEIADAYNGPEGGSPYTVIDMELKDEPEPLEHELCLGCCCNPWND